MIPMRLKPRKHRYKEERGTMIGKLRRTETFLQIGHTGSVGTLDRRVAQTGAWTALPAIDALAMSPRANLPQIRWSCSTRPTHT